MSKEILKELEKEFLVYQSHQSAREMVKKAISLTEKKVVEILESCSVYRNAFILKKQLIYKLEEAFPEK